MNIFGKVSLAFLLIGILTTSASFADSKHRKPRRTFDVCVDAVNDARLTNFPPLAGDRVTAVGMMLPAGTIPSDGSGDASCAAYQAQKIGTFWVNGTFVSTFDTLGKLPQADADDLAYVQWHFRVTGAGAWETSGPIKQFQQNGFYPHVITGGTGRFENIRGEMSVEMLGAGGFQIRVSLPRRSLGRD